MGSGPINKPGMMGYSFPLSPGGDLHRNFVGGDHWTVRLKGGASAKLNTNEMEQMIESWRTNKLGDLDFKAFKK